MIDTKETLLAKIMPWWKANGWNPETLKKKDEVELVAIFYRAQSSKWAIKKKPKPRYEQLSLF